MIGKIAGRLDMIGEDHVLIDTGGVGYIVYVSERTRVSLPPIGEATALFTDMVVREDLLQLYGFPTVLEKEWHRLLQSVQGVGAKAALAIQGTLGPEGVSRAIALGDVSAVKAAPGVGPKIAQRVVNELKDKAPALMALAGTEARPAAVLDAGPVSLETPAATSTGAAQAEALSALINLGYAHGDAASAVARAADENDATSDIIRAALKALSPA